MADPKPDDFQECGAVGGERPKTDFGRGVFEVNCQISHHRGQEVQAANHCPDCDHLYICEACTEAHARKKAKKAHVVVPLNTKYSVRPNEEICAKHGSPLTSYCCTCKEPACKICVQLEHGDHEVRHLRDLIQAKVEEVKVISCKQEEELKQMKVLRDELIALRSAATPHKQDILIKEIEDHTEKCKETLIKKKEELKAEVVKKFGALNEVAADLDEGVQVVGRRIEKLNSSLERASKLLSETKQGQTSYLDKLMSLHCDLGSIATTCNVADGEKFHDRIYKLHETTTRFIPEEPSTLGSLEEVLSGYQSALQLIAKHTLETDSKDKFIPCLANLGDKFAVAHPTLKGKPSDAIDIYEFPKSLKLSLTGNVGPVHDMTSTRNGQLAVLSDGSTGTSSCSVKVFDPNTGKNIVTHNLDIAEPVSLGVNCRSQYVILSGKQQGRAMITVVNDDGSVEREQVIESPGLSNMKPGQITCGWRYILIMLPGKREVWKYEVHGNKLIQISTIDNLVFWKNQMGISASVLDDLFLAEQDVNHNYMNRFIQNYHRSRWDHKYTQVTFGKSLTNEYRISVRGSTIIMSWDQTFAVLQI
ncbi:uncharacterized protein LOC135494432 [Lineus longissimus]|uniref:uncharacterized protein LOC135494432 n=1 Tax=Lineus longissimus TaxID=88925 RepID=UPI00315D7B3B